jgi:hypothetical protein
MEPAKTAVTHDPILVDLALQGGGSHGAFTWGVLDRLLEEPWLGIDGISGTSAGAMNAAVLVDGHAKGGAAGARTALENFWRRVSEAARFSPFRRGPLDVLLGRWTVALGLLIWPAHRGWNVLLLAPAAAILAVGVADGQGGDIKRHQHLAERNGDRGEPGFLRFGL